jgi:hypothetical protein
MRLSVSSTAPYSILDSLRTFAPPISKRSNINDSEGNGIGLVVYYA